MPLWGVVVCGIWIALWRVDYVVIRVRMTAELVAAVQLIAVVGFTYAAAAQVSTPRTPDRQAGDPQRGKVVYARYCTQCHGARGDGNGEAAPFTTPRPRDFRQGLFKFRSTPPGALPLVSDLDQTIRNGLYATSMPPFPALSPSARLDVIAYIQTFSRRWQTDAPATPIAPTPEPTPTRESVARGETLFAKCALCHGNGSGNGTMANSLVDSWGYRIRPADLTRGRTKSAVEGKDIYLRIMTGLNGTPMPGWVGGITSDQAWDIVHYVESLGPWKQSTVRLGADSLTQAASTGITGPMRATAITIPVQMIGSAAGYRFEPDSVIIRVGDAVRFVSDTGGPHNVTFWPDSIPGGAESQLQHNMMNTSAPLTGPMLVKAGDAMIVSFAHATRGVYTFYCMPHVARGMRGKIVVQ
jgi:plastocyanin